MCCGVKLHLLQFAGPWNGVLYLPMRPYGTSETKITNSIEPIPAEFSWPIKNLNLQNCFLSLHKERVVVITTSLDCGKIIMQIKPLKVSPTVASQAEYQFEFSCELKIIAASVVPDVQNPKIAITIVYHNNTTNSCHFKNKAFSISLTLT